MVVLFDVVVFMFRYVNVNSEVFRMEKFYILNYLVLLGFFKSNFKIDFVFDILVRNLRMVGFCWGDSGI